MKLNDRLECVSKYVVGDSVCDVGCDHGKLCASLLISEKVKTAYGIDISEASLNKSAILKDKLNLIGFHLLVGDGFEPVCEKEIDTGVICGIGSNEIIEIIKRQIDFAKSLKRLLLCPLKNTYLVRDYLFQNGFTMADEDIIFENGRYYNIFIVQKGKESLIDDVNIFVGRRLIDKKHPLLSKWLDKRILDIQRSINDYNANARGDWAIKKEHLLKVEKAYRKGRELCRLENF